MQVVLTKATTSFEALTAAVQGAGKYELLPNQAPNIAPDPTITAQAAPEIVAINISSQSWLDTYSPLLLIVAYIQGASLLLQVGLHRAASVNGVETMRYFMAGFFWVFSFFKLLDVNAFADAYSGMTCWPGDGAAGA
jgi:hypothetical protein